MEIATGMVVPIPIALHAKSDSGWQRIGAGVQASRIPSPVVGGKGLTSNDTMLESATSKVRVVLEGHIDGRDDDGHSVRVQFLWLQNSKFFRLCL